MCSKMIVLVGSDGETFEVEEMVAKQSNIINYIIKDSCVNNSIPVPKVTGKILAKVIEYCKRCVDASTLPDIEKYSELHKIDDEFMKVDQETLFDLIRAANFLSIESLSDCTCRTTMDMIMPKISDEICKMFNMKNAFIQEEEENIRKQDPWAFR